MSAVNEIRADYDVSAGVSGDFSDDFDDSRPIPTDDLPDERYLDRELSWLAFNQRVLELAEDPETPLLERVNFLAIFASNLDEFFMVRVAGLKRRLVTGIAVPTNTGRSSQQVLDDISQMTHELQERHASAFHELVKPALDAADLHIESWSDLDEADRIRLDELFSEQIFPVLMPLAVDPAHPFPYISGLSLNLSVRIRNPKTQSVEFARLKVPPILSRFIPLPDDGTGRLRFIPIEDLISNHVGELFPGMEVLEHHEFRVTRNEDVEIDEDESENLIQALERELLRRRFGPPIRLEITDDMDPVTLDLLIGELGITEQEVYRLPAPLGLTGLFELSNLDRPDLKYPPHLPVTSTQHDNCGKAGREGQYVNRSYQRDRHHQHGGHGEDNQHQNARVELLTSQFTLEVPVTPEQRFEVLGVHFLKRLPTRLWLFHRFPPERSVDFDCRILSVHLR